MANAKRERQRANRAKKQEVREAVQAQADRRSRYVSLALLGALLIGLVLLLAYCSRGDDDDSVVSTLPTDEVTVTAETPSAAADDDAGSDSAAGSDTGAGGDTAALIPSGPLPEDFVPWSEDRALSETTPDLRSGIYSAPPEMTIDTSKDYEAVFNTDKGVMRFTLFDDESPITVNNFVMLVNDGFYDGTTFHRVIADFMAQGGDPTGTGMGGPGYTFEDEVDNGFTFDSRGILAMANSGPNTNGSQFFITLAPAEHLNGKHTIFGELLEGDDVLASIRLRDPATDAELGDVVTSIKIVES